MNRGLVRRKRDSGVAFYWVARKASRKAAGYPLKTVRLTGSEADITARCAVLNAELQDWIAGRGRAPIAFDGALASLVDCYQHDEDSPYRAVKANTRRHYDEILRILRHDVGDAIVRSLTAKNFRQWYRRWREGRPDADGTVGPERIRRAHNCMKLLRIVLNFGTSMRYEGCRDAAAILHTMRFELPARRRQQLSYGQAEAIVRQAIKDKRSSVALGQALQFELSLRQKDVIGEWFAEPPGGHGQQGIYAHGWRWANGLLWSDVSADGVLSKETTKTAALGHWQLSLYPLVAMALEAFPADKRIGPMIVSETTGLPYRDDDYRIKWRKIARAAGVPDEVWNMDSRAGGITEASESGAALGDTQQHATHATPAMTLHYIRQNLKATSRVAESRVASRAKPEGTA